MSETITIGKSPVATDTTITERWAVVLTDASGDEPVEYRFNPETYEDRGRLDALCGTSVAPSPPPGSDEFRSLCAWLAAKVGAPATFVEQAISDSRKMRR